jgi:hypothetical protein
MSEIVETCAHCAMAEGAHESGCPRATAPAVEESRPIYVVYSGKRVLASFYSRPHSEQAFGQLVNLNGPALIPCCCRLVEDRHGRQMVLRHVDVKIAAMMMEVDTCQTH